MSVIDDLVQAVQDIENELGMSPAGVYASVRTRLDILESRINNPFAPAPNVDNPFLIGTSGVTISAGTGAPTENRVFGSLYLRKDGYNAQGLYAIRPDGYWHQINTDPGTNRSVGATITNSLSPYTVTLFDDFIPVDSSVGIVTIILPLNPTLGKGYTIVDVTGFAAVRNISISGNGKNINGSSTFVLNSNYQSATVVYNGTSWSKL